MNPLPAFTLIQSVDPVANERMTGGMELFATDRGLAKRWARLNVKLQRTLLASARVIAPGAERDALAVLVRSLDREPEVETVGIWQLDGTAGILNTAIEILNEAQGAFMFFQVEAAVPAGLVSRATRLATWAEENGQNLSDADRRELNENVIADDFFAQAAMRRDEMGLGTLAGVTGYMIAGLDEGDIFWNHFSSGDQRLILVSTDDLRSYAAMADVPFENAVARLVVEQVLTEVSPELDFHEEPHETPCVFDVNAGRVSLVDSLAMPAIHPDCLAKIPLRWQPAAVAMIEGLRSPMARSR